MFGENNPEALIVGAGPVGQFAALALARRGVRVRVVDRGLWPCAQSYALALHPKSMKLLAGLGLRDAVLSSATMVDSIGLYDAKTRRASLPVADGAGDGVAVMRQDVLEGVLEQALKAEGVEIEWRNEVSRIAPGPSSVGVTIDKFTKESRGYVIAHTEWVISKSTEIETPFVIGADGYNSRVRRASKLDFQEVGPAQYFAVFEFKTDADVNREMRIVFGENTTDVVWPLPNGACRWSFEIPGYHDENLEGLQKGLLAAGFDFPSERSKERLFVSQGADSPLLEESSFRAMIAQRAPWFTGQVGEIVWKSIVRFERRLTSAFGDGRLWLAGDAAHLTGPVGIQSMNLGLAEADELAAAIAGVIRKGEPAASLGAYNQKRLGVWRQLHNLAGGVQASAGADPWLAAHASTLTSCLPAYGEDLGALAGKLGLTLARAAGA